MKPERNQWRASLGRVLGNLAVIAVSMGVGLLACEGGLRLFYPQSLALSYKTRDNLTIHRPGHQGVFRGVETEQPYAINSFGMRDYSHRVLKQDGTFRILVLGDSFMEALQVPFERSFPQLLEKRLQALTHRSVEVINAGVAGWGTDEEVIYLARYGLRLSPDLILVGMTLHNDLYDNLEQNFHVLDGDQLVEKPVEDLGNLPYKFWQVKAYLGSHSHLYQLLRTWWHAKEMDQQGRELNAQVAQLLVKKPTRTIERGWRVTFSLFQKLQKLGEEGGARCVVFLIPLALQIDDDRLSRFLRDYGLAPDAIDLDRPQRLMKSFGAANHLAVVDLLPAFRQWASGKGPALYLKKDGHWTESGHQLAANVVAEALIRERILRHPPVPAWEIRPHADARHR